LSKIFDQQLKVQCAVKEDMQVMLFRVLINCDAVQR